MRCVADKGCRGAVDPDAPVALCETHLAMAADWASRSSGIEDLLPSPCRACGNAVGIRYPTGWVCAVCGWRHGEVPDSDLAPPRVDVVYYLRQGDRIKIGTTASPRQRFQAIWHEQVLAFERGDRHLERRRHQQFAEDRFAGSEWFRTTPRLEEHIALVAAGVSDPWELYARWVAEALALR